MRKPEQKDGSLKSGAKLRSSDFRLRTSDCTKKPFCLLVPVFLAIYDKLDLFDERSFFCD